MAYFPFFSTVKIPPHQIFLPPVFYRSSCVSFWVIIGTILIIWTPPLIAANTVIIPYSLEKQGKKLLLSRDDLREIFFGRRTRWPDGSPLKVFVLPDQNPLHIRFSKEVLGVYPYQLRSAWDRMVYSGTGVAPTVVESAEIMKALIRETPNAIGYMEK